MLIWIATIVIAIGFIVNSIIYLVVRSYAMNDKVKKETRKAVKLLMAMIIGGALIPLINNNYGVAWALLGLLLAFTGASAFFHRMREFREKYQTDSSSSVLIFLLTWLIWMSLLVVLIWYLVVLFK